MRLISSHEVTYYNYVFQDRFSVAYARPIVDARQDWTVLIARETSTHTVFKVTRPLVARGSDDHPIQVNWRPICITTHKSV